MDIEHFISNTDPILFGEAESHLQELPFDLYDQQSHMEGNLAPHSVDEVLHGLIQKQDIIDKPISQIVNEALLQYNIPQKKIPQLIKKIKKTKNILKRNRAKNRISIFPERITPPEKSEYIFEESSTEKDTITIEKEIKKQRNRISAQISRDRKKNYVANLEHRNKQLTIESEQLKLENQKLKKQISEKNKEKKQTKGSSGNNFIRLLILLGVVFLTYILKDIFNFKANQSKNISQINENAEDDEELSIISNITDKEDIIEHIRDQIGQIDKDEQAIVNRQVLHQKLSVNSLKEVIIKKVVQMTKKTKTILQPSRLKAHIKLMKNLLSF